MVHQSKSLKYEPSLEPLHISARLLTPDQSQVGISDTRGLNCGPGFRNQVRTRNGKDEELRVLVIAYRLYIVYRQEF